MRKVALISRGHSGRRVGIAAVASAVQGTQTVSLSLQNKNAGTKEKPRSVGKLTVVTHDHSCRGRAAVRDEAGRDPLRQEHRLRQHEVPELRQSVVQSDPTKCPSGSKVGRGSATAVPSTGGQVLPKIAAYNGQNGKKIYLLVTEPTFQVKSVLDGTLKTDTGKYGSKLDVEIPPNLQNVGGHRRDADQVHDHRRRHRARAPRTSASRAAPAASSLQGRLLLHGQHDEVRHQHGELQVLLAVAVTSRTHAGRAEGPPRSL